MIGYKAFNKNLTTRNNMKFSLGQIYHVDGPIKAGPIGGNGFHFCLNFEDTFRFVDREGLSLCRIIALGEISEEYEDNFYGYDNIYACSDMYIAKIYTREEIMEMAKQLTSPRLERFIQTYPMTLREALELKSILSEHDSNLNNFIDYYQLGNTDAFQKGPKQIKITYKRSDNK